MTILKYDSILSLSLHPSLDCLFFGLDATPTFELTNWLLMKIYEDTVCTVYCLCP